MEGLVVVEHGGLALMGGGDEWAEHRVVWDGETYILVQVLVCGLFSKAGGGRRVGVSWALFADGGTVGVRDGVL